MPFEGELAGYGPLRRMVQNRRVGELLSRYTIMAKSPEQLKAAAALWKVMPASSWDPSHVVAIDGGEADVPHQSGFPGAEACYLTVAAVLLDVKKMRELDVKRPVDPVKFRETQRVGSIDCAIPGHNMVLDGEKNTADSLRRVVYEVLGTTTVIDDGETLLQTYEGLLAKKPGGHDPKCPNRSCTQTFTPTAGITVCTCGTTIYSTDALRFHEDMVEEKANRAMYAEVRQVLEMLTLINVMRSMEKLGILDCLKEVAFVLDGPLAVFGHPAWLSQAIWPELIRLNKEVRKVAGKDILLLGIEKSGDFFTHLQQLDEGEKGQAHQLPKGSYFLLDDAYIKSHIKFTTSGRPYGDITYFGRKFLVKTRSGALVVALLPFLRENDKDTSTALEIQYPRLDDALRLLNTMVSSRYEHGLVPLVVAHSEAAIPLNLGKKIFETMARQLVKVKQG